MDFFQILFVGGIIGVLLIAAIFGVLPLAALVYVWRRVFPIAERIALWAAKPANLFSLLLLTILLFLLSIFGASYVSAWLILLIVFPIILTVIVELAILVWIIRLLQWLYRHWREWLVSLYYSARLTLIKLRIEIDTLREEGFRGRLNNRNHKNRYNNYNNKFDNKYNNRLNNRPNN